MKTNFQNGTLVTPAFLNAINSPVWKQVPANDGEFKPPALTDMPDVEAAIAAMQPATPGICTVDLTACVAYRAGASDVDVLLSSLIDVAHSSMKVRNHQGSGIYSISSVLKFNASVSNANAFYLKIPDSAFQDLPWTDAFLTAARTGLSSASVSTYGEEYLRSAWILNDPNHIEVYTNPWSPWADVVPGASIVSISALVFP